jgi:hypothetical protein
VYTNIFGQTGSPAIASETGRIVEIGRSRRLGLFVQLRDAYGTTYTYANLGSVANRYPAAKPWSPMVFQRAAQLVPPAAPSLSSERAAASVEQTGTTPTASAAAPPHPTSTPIHYVSQARVVQLSGAALQWRSLRAGALVPAGTVLGRIGVAAAGQKPHLRFMIRPATADGPLIDPGPVLDGWRVLERTKLSGVRRPGIGQALLMGEPALAALVLSDSRIKIYPCSREEIGSGQIDRRVLATLEFLADSGLSPTVNAPDCGRPGSSSSLSRSAYSTRSAVDILAVNGTAILHHQGPGSVTEKTVRRLLSLQGTMQPDRIITLMRFPDADNAAARSDAGSRIEIQFRPRFGANTSLMPIANTVFGAGTLTMVGATAATGGTIKPPPGAPTVIAAIVRAGNAIATLPYIYGGGHASLQANGYDCSGSVSYALAAAGLVSSPMVSGQFESWGLPGPGRWITVYANADHVWMTVAGWRYDTVALAESGTRWAPSGGEYSGFVVRHPAGL